MDSYPNEHPTGGFFGGGYESAFQAIRLDSDKIMPLGRPLVVLRNYRPTALQATLTKWLIVQVNSF